MTCSWQSGRAAPRPDSNRRSRSGRGPVDGKMTRLRQSGCRAPSPNDGRRNRSGAGPADSERALLRQSGCTPMHGPCTDDGPVCARRRAGDGATPPAIRAHCPCQHDGPACVRRRGDDGTIMVARLRRSGRTAAARKAARSRAAPGRPRIGITLRTATPPWPLARPGRGGGGDTVTVRSAA